MLKFVVNLSMLFTEKPLLERFSAARAAGFQYIEIQFPYEWEQAKIKQQLVKNNQQMVLFNVPAGDRAAGDRGIAANPFRQAEFRAGVHTALEWAIGLGVTRLNCSAGKKLAECSREEQLETLVSNLRYGAEVLGQAGIQLLIEPLNRYDIPDFLLDTISETLAIIEKVDRPNVLLLYDIYHAQRTGGELAGILHRHLSKVGHIQIADNPGRHQPGTGEINFPFLLREIDRVGYQGFVSLEYEPYPDTPGSLGWLREWGLVK